MKQIKILIVDDEPGHLLVLGEILEMELTNLSFFEAHNGRQALAIIKNENDLDLIISDIQMPQLSGVELLKKVKEIKPDLPVLLLTGNSNYERKKIIELGAVDLIYKPYDFEELVKIIQQSIKQCS